MFARFAARADRTEDFDSFVEVRLIFKFRINLTMSVPLLFQTGHLNGRRRSRRHPSVSLQMAMPIHSTVPAWPGRSPSRSSSLFDRGRFTFL